MNIQLQNTRIKYFGLHRFFRSWV